MKTLTRITVLILAGLAISCQKNNPVETKNVADNILPLSVGNRWQYSAWMSPSFTGSIIWEVAGQTNVNSIQGVTTGYILDYYDSGSAPPDNRYIFSNGAEGLFSLGGISSTDTLFLLTLAMKYPVAVGESWQVPNVVYSFANETFYVKDTLKYTLVADNDTLVTPAGIFTHCYVYNHLERQAPDVSGFDDFYDYYVPKVGLVGTIVRTVIRGVAKDTSQRMLLSSYTLK